MKTAPLQRAMPRQAAPIASMLLQSTLISEYSYMLKSNEI